MATCRWRWRRWRSAPSTSSKSPIRRWLCWKRSAAPARARPRSARPPGGTPINRQAQEKVASLSERQRQVLRGILKGQPNKVIAWELGLSIRTVEAYRAQLLIKLGVRGTAEAVRLAMAAGLGGEDG